MERQYIITNDGYIVAEYVGTWMETAVLGGGLPGTCRVATRTAVMRKGDRS
jgi:hypothetical protein